MSKKEKPSPLKKLLKAWTAAGPEDRQAFLDLVAAEGIVAFGFVSGVF
ncbi:MAG: hypothetical protein ACK40W_09920 [Allorhizobium sp.]